MNIIQLSVGGFDNNFSYIIYSNKKAILIDPTGNKEIIENKLKELNLSLELILTTHSHPDHIELLDYFKQFASHKTFEQLKTKPVFSIDEMKIKTLFTPGHTQDSVCFLIKNNLFSGDTLFCRGVGTTAYGGSTQKLNDTLNYLESLNGEINLWSGHDYGGSSCKLKEALSLAHKKPSKEVLEKIKKKVSEYEEKAGRTSKQFQSE